MKRNGVKLCAVAPNLRVADVEYNLGQIELALERAEREGVDLLVLPRLALCGVTAGDLLLQPSLIRACKAGIDRLALATQKTGVTLVVGAPIEKDGALCDCAVVLRGGETVASVGNTKPSYEESRYFSAAKVQEAVRLDGYELSIAFDFEDESADGTVILYLPVSPELVRAEERRVHAVKKASFEKACAAVCVCPSVGESSTDGVYSGHAVVAVNGEKVGESLPFVGGAAMAEICVETLENERRKRIARRYPAYEERVREDAPFLPLAQERSKYLRTAIEIQAQGLARRMKQIGAKTAVLGVSGGLDSTLALVSTARAIDILGAKREDLVAVTMPGFGTTGRTYENALKLIKGFGATLREVPIAESVLQHFKDIGHDGKTTDAAYENAQARVRTLILMDIANMTGGLVVGTGDLSELALGWCTYNGDHMSMYSLNGSIPKTLVKELVAYAAENAEGELKEALNSVVGTEISPELLPPDKQGNIAQKTEDLVGPYELHDFYLYHAIYKRETPTEVFEKAKKAFEGKYGDETVKKWLKNFYKRFFTQQFKRSCMPDGVQVTCLSLSPRGAWKMPSDAFASVWIDEIENL